MYFSWILSWNEKLDIFQCHRSTTWYSISNDWLGLKFSVQCLCAEIKWAVLCKPRPENWSIKDWPLVVRSGKILWVLQKVFLLLFSNRNLRYTMKQMWCIWKWEGKATKENDVFIPPCWSSALSFCCATTGKVFRPKSRAGQTIPHSKRAQTGQVNWIPRILSVSSCLDFLQFVSTRVQTEVCFFMFFLRSILSFLRDENVWNLRRRRVALL